MGNTGLWPRRARESECDQASLLGLDARTSDLLSRAMAVEGMTPKEYVDWCAQVEGVRGASDKIREYLQLALVRVQVLACNSQNLRSWNDVREEMERPIANLRDRTSRERLIASVAYARDVTPALHMIWDAQSLGEA
jgi:hypothetical protein